MKTSHTPGPWKLDIDVFGGDRFYVRDDLKAYVAEAFRSVKVSPEQQRANARLIAAAPDLLTEARAMEIFSGNVLCALQGVIGMDPNDSRILPLLRQLAEDAELHFTLAESIIAKATA